jgi:hypothetical protein
LLSSNIRSKPKQHANLSRFLKIVAFFALILFHTGLMAQEPSNATSASVKTTTTVATAPTVDQILSITAPSFTTTSIGAAQPQVNATSTSARAQTSDATTKSAQTSTSAEKSTSAQTSTSAQKDSVVLGFLPALSYDSDNGFIGGGLFSRFHYDTALDPYRSQFLLYGFISTRGLFSLGMVYDHVETAGHKLRGQHKVSAARILETPYFGVGNDAPFDESQWDNNYYFFESYVFDYELKMRRTMWNHASRKRTTLDLVGISHVRMMLPQLGSGGSLIEDEVPENTDGGWAMLGGLGINWENRNKEIGPTSGNQAQLDLRLGSGVVADYPMWVVNFLGAHYVTRRVLLPVTLALKTGYMQAGGEVPFFILPQLGGENTFRGYPPGRFRGDAILYYTAELRTWFYELPDRGFRIGGQVFTDGGRVFMADEILPEFLNDHKHTFGLGGAVSLFTYDFIIRGEIGFSDEISRIYFGIGYAF